MEQTQLHPAWRRAVRLFVDEGKTYGATLTHAWLYEAFSLVPPTDDTPRGVAAKAQLAFLGQFKRFEDEMLSEHQMALRPVRGIGYEVVEANEQTRYGYDRGMHEIRKGLRRAVRTVGNVNLSLLTAEERRDNADAMAKLAGLRGMIRSAETQERITNALGFSKEDE